MNQDIPEYVRHPGTVLVSGTSASRKVAWCALGFLDEGRPNVEFMFIGASAGQQALKAIGLTSIIFEERNEGKYLLFFRPLRFRTVIRDAESAREVEAQVWRTYVIPLEAISSALNTTSHEQNQGSSPR